MTQTTFTTLAVSFAVLVAALPTQATEKPVQTGVLQVHVWEDAQGKQSSIPGATVELSNPNGSIPKRVRQTDLDGLATFSNLPLNSGYRLEVIAAGYGPMPGLTVTVSAGATQTIEVQLWPSQQEEVQVVGGHPPIEVAQQETTVGTEYFSDLPVTGRVYKRGLVLAPGVNDPTGDGAVTVHASRERDFKVSVADRSTVDPLTGRLLSGIAPDSIEEIQVDGADREGYAQIVDNSFLPALREPLSTFSIDVDTASYTNMRRFLTSGSLPPAPAIRIEELLNYFQYDDPVPVAGEPFAVSTELAACPWSERHALLRIGLKATPVQFVARRPGNYVLLIDVSGSMDEPAKLPLVKLALKMLVQQFSSADEVAIVVYAGAAGLVLDSRSDRSAIEAAIDNLDAGGSTAGGEGIRLAYSIATKNFIEGGINRVILATDGDFNVGISSEGELVRLIQAHAKSGVFLSVFGFGTGNLQDAKMEQLADHGNGQYAYIDSALEARRAMVEQAGGTLITLAKDVKVQVEFNPATVAQYRLIGYENRILAAEDFLDDTKDAGEIGAGHSVTALFEIVPVGASDTARAVEPLKYSRLVTKADAKSAELATVKLRFKAPDADVSVARDVVVMNKVATLATASGELKFAAAVAAFGMVLRESPDRGSSSFELARQLATAGVGHDPNGQRHEFVQLIGKAVELQRLRGATN